MAITTGFIIAFVSALLGAGLGGLIVHIQARLRAIEKQVAEMQPPSNKRHTYPTNAGLEDALAVLLDIQFRRDAETARLNQAMDILRQVRSGPHAYDQDRPAGKRPERWDS